MSAEFPSLDRLESQVRALAVAEKPSEVFRLLLESARLSGPRAAVFLLRQGRIKGWGSLGYDSASSQRQRAFSAPAEAGWLGEIGAGTDPRLHLREASGVDPDFGQNAADEAAAIAVRVKGKPIAFLVAERRSGEEPWFPACLGVLVQVAELRLDLDLARRKLRATADPTGAAAEPPAAAAPVSEPAVPDAATEPVPATAPAAAPSATAVSPVAEPAPASSDEDRILEAARRFARLVATDIRLYNEEAVALGRRHGDLEERLSEHLTRGKETFLRRHGGLGPAGLDILREAYVQVLAGGQAELLSPTVFS